MILQMSKFRQGISQCIMLLLRLSIFLQRILYMCLLQLLRIFLQGSLNRFLLL